MFGCKTMMTAEDANQIAEQKLGENTAKILKQTGLYITYFLDVITAAARSGYFNIAVDLIPTCLDAVAADWHLGM